MPLVIQGATSGSTTIQATDAVTATITLPSATTTLVGKTTPSFTTTIGVGNATPSASGAGITFPAAQSASTDANTLDDYEEGTWTPTLTFGGASVGITYTAQIGTYTKVGRMVTCIAQLATSNKGSSTGNAAIASLPFTHITSSSQGALVLSVVQGFTITGQPLGRSAGATTTIDLFQLTAGTFASLTNTNISTSGIQIDFSITYFV